MYIPQWQENKLNFYSSFFNLICFDWWKLNNKNSMTNRTKMFIGNKNSKLSKKRDKNKKERIYKKSIKIFWLIKIIN